MRVLVLGANGPTGRLVVQRALDRGFDVTASTRRPDAFPIRDDRLRVAGGDATDPEILDGALKGCDAVVSVIGARYTRQPVSVYSATARALVPAMARHGVRRMLVVTSAEVARETALQGSFVPDRIVVPLLRHVVGRTVYDDMVRMEAAVRRADLDWTIVRPPGLTDQHGRGYAAAETHVAGSFCARDDLAAFLLDELEQGRFIHRVAAVSTPGLRVSALDTVRREVLKR